MTSIVYREVEATNQTDTNFEVYSVIYTTGISLYQTLMKKEQLSQDLVFNPFKVILLIFCSRIIVVDNY